MAHRLNPRVGFIVLILSVLALGMPSTASGGTTGGTTLAAFAKLTLLDTRVTPSKRKPPREKRRKPPPPDDDGKPYDRRRPPREKRPPDPPAHKKKPPRQKERPGGREHPPCFVEELIVVEEPVYEKTIVYIVEEEYYDYGVLETTLEESNLLLGSLTAAVNGLYVLAGEKDANFAALGVLFGVTSLVFAVREESQYRDFNVLLGIASFALAALNMTGEDPFAYDDPFDDPPYDTRVTSARVAPVGVTLNF